MRLFYPPEREPSEVRRAGPVVARQVMAANPAFGPADPAYGPVTHPDLLIPRP